MFLPKIYIFSGCLSECVKAKKFPLKSIKTAEWELFFVSLFLILKEVVYAKDFVIFGAYKLTLWD
jgi:hypothetical protein